MPTTTIAPELMDFLRRQTGSTFAQSLVTQFDRRGSLSPAQVAAAERMQAQAQERAARPAVAPVDPGFYLVDEVVYKVKASQAGNPYAVARVNGSWDYRGTPARNGITADHRITPEVAAAHGVETGICIFCNAELDDRDGLGKVVGVGPVCARKHLGMTQRQLADRLGVQPVAAAPEAAPMPSNSDRLEIARRALLRERRENIRPTAEEQGHITFALDTFGPEAVYMDGELFSLMAY